MITRTVRLQLAAFLVISVLGIAYAGANYVGLGRTLFGNAYTVTAMFPSSGGIFKGAEVTERGVTVGRVTGLRLAPGGVAVSLQLDGGTRVPADTTAQVSDLSAVGEQYVDLRPRSDGPPYLRDGSTIGLASTSVPIADDALLLHLDRTVSSVDRQHLSTLIDELGKAFAGTGPDLQALIDHGDSLTTAMSQALPQTESLIEQGKTVLDTQRAVSGDLKTWAHGLAQLSGTLRGDDPQLRQLLDNGIVSADEVRSLLEANNGVLPVLLDNLVTVGRIQAVPVRIAGLKTILTVYPQDVYNGFNVVPAGADASRFGLVTDQNAPVCTTDGAGDAPGYVPPDERRSGAGNDPSRDYGGTAKRNAYCLLPHDSMTDVRGARNAPRPPGDTTGGPGGHPESAPDPAPDQQAGAAAVTPTSPSSLGSSGAPVVPYDPITGLLSLPDGQEMIIGEDGGQQQYLGQGSWRWLLLAPLGGS